VTKTYIIVALVSYLLGSIPFGYILVKLFLKQDIRATGSGNIGATNVARSGAKGLAIATLLLDAAKGYVAIVVSGAICVAAGFKWGNQDCWGCNPFSHAYMFSALWAVIGHMFPIWLKFRGGKGVATALGALALVDPVALSLCVVAFAISVVLTRYVSLSSIIAAVCYPVVMLTFGLSKQASIRDVWPVIAISLLIIAKHHENIRRLLAGTENKFGGKKSVPPPDAMEKQA
jgi:acyl phosphate:glycerol-3-phosphate acyltransferase